MYAESNGHTDVVKMLHEFGGNANLQKVVRC